MARTCLVLPGLADDLEGMARPAAVGPVLSKGAALAGAGWLQAVGRALRSVLSVAGAVVVLSLVAGLPRWGAGILAGAALATAIGLSVRPAVARRLGRPAARGVVPAGDGDTPAMVAADGPVQDLLAVTSGCVVRLVPPEVEGGDAAGVDCLALRRRTAHRALLRCHGVRCAHVAAEAAPDDTWALCIPLQRGDRLLGVLQLRGPAAPGRGERAWRADLEEQGRAMAEALLAVVS